MKNEVREIKRGEIYMANLPKVEGTSIQWGIRPAVVVSNDLCNKYSPVIHLAPITSATTKNNLPTHIAVGLDNGLKLESMVLLEQTSLLPKDVIFKHIGRCSGVSLFKLNVALMVQFGLMQFGFINQILLMLRKNDKSYQEQTACA